MNIFTQHQFKKLLTPFVVLLFTAIMPCYAQKNINFKDALNAASANNQYLQSQKYYIDIAAADTITAKLRPNPSFNTQILLLTDRKYFSHNTGFTNPYNRQDWMQFTKPMQIYGQRKSKLDYAKAKTTTEKYNYKDAERSLRFDVANTWLAAWYAQQVLNINIIAGRKVDSLNTLNEIRYQKKAIVASEHIRTRILAKQLTIAIKNARLDYKTSTIDLAVLMGTTDTIGITDSGFNTPFQNINKDTLYNQAVTLRPDIASINAQQNAATANIDLQKRIGKIVPEAGAIINPQNAVPYYGVYLTLPLPVFARNQGEISKSYLFNNQLRKQNQALLLQLKADINKAFSSYNTQQQNLQIAQQTVQEADSVLKSVQLIYLKGGTTIIDYLEAQRTWLDTYSAYISTQLAYRKSYVTIYYVTGLINSL